MKGWEASTGSRAGKGLLVRLSVQWEADGSGHHQRSSREGADEFVFPQPLCCVCLICIPTEMHN